VQLRPLGRSCTVRSDRSGYAEFSAWLAAQLSSGLYAPITVCMEPTGVYHEPWAYAITHDFGGEIALQFINPYQTKQKRQQRQNGRRRKTDALDVEAMAASLREGLGRPVHLLLGETFHFTVWAATFRRVYRDKQRLQVALRSQLDRLWPGLFADVRAFRRAHPDLPAPKTLVLTNPLERQTIQLLLTHAPNPYAWLDRAPEEIRAFYQAHGLRFGLAQAQRFHDALHGAMLLPPELVECLVERFGPDWQRFQALQQQVACLRQEAESLAPTSPAAVMMTIPGVNAFLAVGYLAYVVDAQRFAKADQIWSLAGFAPQQEESGDARWDGRMTRRGNPGLRNILFTIGLNTSQYCPAIRRAKERARRNGKGPVGAVVHAAHCANRLCFALLRNQVAYQPERMR
jgi:transposase